MAVFVELQTDAFANVLSNYSVGRMEQMSIRRPYRGIEIKDDTYATMTVMRADGSVIPLVDAGGTNFGGAGGSTTAASKTNNSNEGRMPVAFSINYANFIINTISDNRQEKSQILQTFGDPFIFFFGEQPRILQVSGLLMNTRDFNWRTEFWYNYEHYLRGTKLVEMNARIYLNYDDIVVEGYMLGAQAQDDVNLPYHIPFSFNLFVTAHTYLGNVGDDAYPVTTAVRLPMDQLTVEGKTNVMLAMDELKGGDLAGNLYESNVEITRRALENSERARLDADADSISGRISRFSESETGQGLNAAKNTLAGALAIGVQAQNLTFLSAVNHLFKNRRVIWPRGMAGSEAYVGLPSYANSAYPFAAYPRREKALRSKIRDNFDEYVIPHIDRVQYDNDAIKLAEEEKESSSTYTLEKRVLQDLEDMGLDTTQHPGGSPFTKGTHGIKAFDNVGPAVLLSLSTFALKSVTE